MEGVAVTVDLWSDGSLRESTFALFTWLTWDTAEPVQSLRLTTTKSLVPDARVVVHVVILVSILSVGGAFVSLDNLRILKMSALSLLSLLASPPFVG